MIIREAQETDASALSQLLEQLGYPTTEEESLIRIKLHQKDYYKIFIATVETEAVGFIALHWYHALHHPRPIGRVVAFCFDENYRSKGHGTQLLKFAEDFLMEKNCLKVELTSNRKRKKSHDYYLTKGYQQASMHFVKYLGP